MVYSTKDALRNLLRSPLVVPLFRRCPVQTLLRLDLPDWVKAGVLLR